MQVGAASDVFNVPDVSGLIEIGNNEKFVSPNGEFTVQGNVEIINNKTGDQCLVEVLSPVYSLKWTRDSKTIVVIGRIAHGSYASVIHYNGKEWKKYEVDPPDSDEGHFWNYSVIREEIGFSDVVITYKINTKKNMSDAYVSHLCTLRVDPATGVISEIKRIAQESKK